MSLDSRYLRWRRCVLGIAVTLVAGLAAAADEQTPLQIVDSTSQAVAAALDGRRDQLRENPPELYEAINGILLPVFDFRYAGYLVMGSNWKTATDQQKDDFIDAFYNFLLRAYAESLLDYDENSINILPAAEQPQGKSKRTMIKTEMTMDDGSVSPVNYSLRKGKTGWKLYDVRINGVSYIQNYRNQFSTEIEATGLDAVIARLSAEAADLDMSIAGTSSDN